MACARHDHNSDMFHFMMALAAHVGERSLFRANMMVIWRSDRGAVKDLAVNNCKQNNGRDYRISEHRREGGLKQAGQDLNHWLSNRVSDDVIGGED